METLFQTFIDPSDWDEANWLGILYFHDPTGANAPMLGLLFKNIEPGKRIFTHWRKRLGERDAYEELRISIVEGEIFGLAPGYSVRISSDPAHTEQRFQDSGMELNWKTAVLMSRIHRMTPDAGSENLTHFKQEFARHKKYLLVPVSWSLQPEMDFAIEKREIIFRNAADIREDDPDALVFPRHHFERGTIQ